MAEALGGWANPSSVHAEGRAARALLEEARHRILKGLGAWSGARLVFTSGATEALALALSRTRADHVLVGATEHDAVLRAAPTRRVSPSTVPVLPIWRRFDGSLAAVDLLSSPSSTSTMKPASFRTFPPLQIGRA